MALPKPSLNCRAARLFLIVMTITHLLPNTQPQLEIFADDVKCTHGATIGQLREDALFYLRARGIPLAEAQGLLVYAFAAEVLEKITIDEVREKLEAALFEKLAS
jgi:Fe-S cluster assembly protein SufD